MAALASRRDSPSRRTKNCRFSRAVSVGYSAICCGTRPSARRACAGSRSTTWPATAAVPALGLRSVASTDSVEVFPAPFGPSRPTTSPASTVKLTPSSAARVP
jgi:hypothetical protein